eukprot:scaffold120292_cov15-Tisochrysis_lutea.AAC.1
MKKSRLGIATGLHYPRLPFGSGIVLKCRSVGAQALGFAQVWTGVRQRDQSTSAQFWRLLKCRSNSAQAVAQV